MLTSTFLFAVVQNVCKSVAEKHIRGVFDLCDYLCNNLCIDWIWISSIVIIKVSTIVIIEVL